MYFIWQCFRWCFWRYLGVTALLIALPVWPWQLYTLWNREPDESGACVFNWHRQPITHTEKLMYMPVDLFRDAFDFGIDCMCHE